jgi:hypothetical protein
MRAATLAPRTKSIVWPNGARVGEALEAAAPSDPSPLRAALPGLAPRLSPSSAIMRRITFAMTPDRLYLSAKERL